MVDILQNTLQSFATVLEKAIGNLADAFVNIFPYLVGALFIILFGWFVAKIVKQIIVKILQSTKMDQWIDEQNLTAAIGGKETSSLIGSFVKWYIIAVFLGSAASLLETPYRTTGNANYRILGLSEFMQNLVAYIPLVLAALMVLVLGLLLGRYLKNALDATQHKFKKIAGALTEMVVVLFAGMLALTLVLGESKVQILVQLLNLFLGPFIWSIAIAVGIVVGISFGLAFKKEIQQFANEIKKSSLK